MTDLLMLNAIGPAFTKSTTEKGIGGSELEVTQIAHAMAKRGHKVVVANGVDQEHEEEGVLYVPLAHAPQFKARALFLERTTPIPDGVIVPPNVVVRATDVYFDGYDVHRPLLERGATLAINTVWQAKLFPFGTRRVVIPPMLDPTPRTQRVPGRFVYASAPLKGLDATLDMWRHMSRTYQDTMHKCHLEIVTPGRFDFYADRMAKLSPDDADLGISYRGSPTLHEYRRAIARAEGLFFVNTMAETFCCAAALAERSGTRPHILCRAGFGGIPEALAETKYVSSDEDAFVSEFLAAIGKPARRVKVVDRSPEALAPKWEEILQLKPEPVPNVRTDTPHISTTILDALKGKLADGGSEYGALLSYFQIAVSTRAATIVEIGRFTGASTLAFASALKFLDSEGWQECAAARQRPDVDYPKHEGARSRRLISIDPAPKPEAVETLKAHGLLDYVMLIDKRSDDCVPHGEPIDVLLIDGDHSYDQCRRDFDRWAPFVRRGGYILMHDAFGWYEGSSTNGSPIKRALEDLWALHSERYERILIDTGYASFYLLRKLEVDSGKVPAKVPPRADGQPTIGLVMISRDDNPLIARAINSVRGWVDAVTVVVDTETKDGTGDLCEQLGAEVHYRPFPGSLAEARNESIAIAEQRTDYLLVLDPDDRFEGSRPILDGKDHYMVDIVDGPVVYQRVQLFKSGLGFRYVGCERGCKGRIPHEYLYRPGATIGRLRDLRYHRLGGVRGATSYQDRDSTRDKYLKHARELEHHHLDHPEDTRTVYYLGQSYRDASEGKDKDLLKKAREWFVERAQMGGFAEEAYTAAYEAGRINEYLGEDPTEAYLRAHSLRPIRAEPLVSLAIYYRDDKRRLYEAAYTFAVKAAALPRPDDVLFVDESVYRWKAVQELGISAHYTGRREEAVAAYERLATTCPPEVRAQVLDTLERFVRPGLK